MLIIFTMADSTVFEYFQCVGQVNIYYGNQGAHSLMINCFAYLTTAKECGNIYHSVFEYFHWARKVNIYHHN